MKETSEELPNFSIGIDFLGPDPTRSKNEAKKNMQVARFANLLEDYLQQILAKRHSLATPKVTNCSLTPFKGKISVFIVVFKFSKPGESRIQLLTGNLPNNQGSKKCKRDQYFRNKTTKYSHALSQN